MRHDASVSANGYTDKSCLICRRAGYRIGTVLFVSAPDTTYVAVYPIGGGKFVSMSLSQLFTQARDAVPGLSNRDIAKAAGVSSATVNRMMKGTGSPELANVDAVARVLKIPLTEARREAGFPAEIGGPYSGPAESQFLTRRQRDALDELIKAFVSTLSAYQPQYPTTAIPDPLAATENPASGGDEDGDERRQLGSR